MAQPVRQARTPKMDKESEVNTGMVKAPEMFLYRKLSGKHHMYYKGQKKTVQTGEIIELAGENWFAGDLTWQCLGPVEPVNEVPASNPAPTGFPKKVLVGEGLFDVYRADETQVNDTPITEEEADEILDALLEGK